MLVCVAACMQLNWCRKCHNFFVLFSFKYVRVDCCFTTLLLHRCLYYDAWFAHTYVHCDCRHCCIIVCATNLLVAAFSCQVVSNMLLFSISWQKLRLFVSIMIVLELHRPWICLICTCTSVQIMFTLYLCYCCSGSQVADCLLEFLFFYFTCLSISLSLCFFMRPEVVWLFCGE